MKELFTLLFKFRLSELFFKPTENGLIKFTRYAFVGGIAFIIDAGVLFLLEYLGLHYLIATMYAFLLGLVINFILSKLFVFTEKTNVKYPINEFIIFVITGLIGLGITEVLMYTLTDKLNLYFMISKVMVAIIVLVWNYGSRKYILYRH